MPQPPASHALATQPLYRLLQGEHGGAVEQSVPLIEGIYFSWDSEGGTVALKLEAPPGTLCAMTGRVSGAPDWFSFNIALGQLTLSPGDVLGVIADVTAPSGEACPLYIRSQHDDKFIDMPLSVPLQGTLERDTQVILHSIDTLYPMLGLPAFHTLVLPLPRRDFTLTLHDLQIFHLPAAAGIRSAPVTLSGFGV